MSVRPIDLLDLPILYRYRRDVLALDSIRLLTRGQLLGPSGLLPYLSVSRRVYTAVCNEGVRDPLLGGLTRPGRDPLARLSFLAPRSGLENGALLSLLDHLAVQAGQWGCLYLLAEVEELSTVFPALRQTGFAVYAWQNFWDLGALSPAGPGQDGWRPMRPSDLPAVQALCQQIIPALLQPVDACPRRAEGLVFQAGGRLQACVRTASGQRGVLIQPLFHPEAAAVDEMLRSLLCHLRRGGRGMYLCMRSYQAWLEPVLAELGAAPGPRQALMVRTLGAVERLEKNVLAKREHPLANPAAPLARTDPNPRG